MNSSGEELPVEEIPVEEIPVEEFEFSAEEIPTTEEIPGEEIPGEEIPVVAFSALDFPTEEEWLAGILAAAELPAEEVPAEEVPVEEVPEEEVPAEDFPVEEVPAEDFPVEEVPVEELPAEEVPVEESPTTDTSPTEESPVLSIPEFNIIHLPFSEDFSQYKNICFISHLVDTFSQYLNTDTYPVIYNDSADRERLKTDLLSQFNTIDRVCFVFHGPSSATASNSSLFAPKTFIHKEKFFTITEDDTIEGGENLVFIQELCNALQVKHVDFLACNLLQTVEWQKYFALFPSNVVVGASDNNSGNLKYGGDWILENTMEDIRDMYLNKNTIDDFTGLLVDFTYAVAGGTFTYTVDLNNRVSITGISANWTGELVIPSYIDDKPVITIYGLNHNTFSSLIVPVGVTTIGNNAVQNCTSLVSVSLPTTGLIQILSSAFSGCTNLSTINLPEGLQEIANYAFYGCKIVASIPSTVTIIGDYAFYGNRRATVTIPSNVTTWGIHSFSASSQLHTITIKFGVTSIPDGTFESCPKIRTILIPNTIETINKSAFNSSGNSSNPKVIVVPSSVTSIGPYAFKFSYVSAVYFCGNTIPELLLDNDNVTISAPFIDNINPLKTYYLSTVTDISVFSQTNFISSNHQLIPLTPTAMYNQMITDGVSVLNIYNAGFLSMEFILTQYTIRQLTENFGISIAQLIADGLPTLTNGTIKSALNFWVDQDGYLENKAIAIFGHINFWDVSGITVLGSTDDAGFFPIDFDLPTYGKNPIDISRWNVSNVTTLKNAFKGCIYFNGDISDWDVSNVTNMSQMFYGANTFNYDISRWNVSRVTNMSQMFYGASVFNADLSRWDVGNVLDMNGMFKEASSFNKNIGGWNVSRVTDMNYFLDKAYAFTQDLSPWNVTGFPSQPIDFNLDGILTPALLPVWGSWPADKAFLISLVSSSGVLSPAFASNTFSYTLRHITLPFTTTPYVIPGSTVTIDKTTETPSSGNITISVTSRNGAISNIYTFAVELSVSSWYSISLSINSGTGVNEGTFNGYFSVDNTTNLLTAFYETINGVTDFGKNILVQTGNGRELGEVIGFKTYAYRSLNYDNAYLPTWFQFSKYGVLIKTMSAYPQYALFTLGLPYNYITGPVEETQNRSGYIETVSSSLADYRSGWVSTMIYVVYNTITNIVPITYQAIKTVGYPGLNLANSGFRFSMKINTYYHTFYTVSATTPTVMTRTIYDNFGGLVDTTDISFGGQNIADTMALMNGGGTNPFTIGIADSAQNKISMDIASCGLYTTSMTSTQKTKLISYVNTTFKEPYTMFTAQYKVTVSDGVISLADSAGSSVQSIALNSGSTYLFDQSDSSNTGTVFKLSSSSTSLVEITSGVTRYNTPGTLNAYMTISPVVTSTAYLFDPVRILYVKVSTNILSQLVFAISATTAGGTYYNQPEISFVSGNSYKFIVSDSSVSGYSLVFGSSNEIANTSLYTASGTPGQAGAYVSLDLTAGYTGTTIRYFELTRTGMGYTPYINPAPAAPDNVWYKFEKGDISGTTVKNYATNTYTGTIAVPSVFGAVSLSSTNNIDSSTNVVGMSSLFLDSKQHINFSTNSASGTTKPPSALLSVSFWAKNTLTSITRKDFPLWYYGPGQDWLSQNNFYISYGVWTDPSKNAISFSFNNALYWTTEAQTGTFRTDEKWHHFCVVADLTTVKLYYDASMVINKNVTNPVNTSQNYAYRYLGTDFHFNGTPATGPYFKGYFDDYRMYNSALTAADVSGLYSYRTEYAVSISGGVIYLNGIYNPIVTFVAGGRYIFDQSGNSNSSNQIMFSRVASGNPTFTDGVTVVGTPGQAGAYTRVDLSGGFTGSLYYLSQSTFIPTFSSITTAVGSKFYFSADTSANYVLDASNNVIRWKNRISGQVDASANTYGGYNNNQFPKIVNDVSFAGGLPFMKLAGGTNQVGFNYSGGGLTGSELNQQTFFMFGYMYGKNIASAASAFFAKPGVYGAGGNTLHINWVNDDLKLYALNLNGIAGSTNILNANPGYYMFSITVDCSASSQVNIQAYGLLDTNRTQQYTIDDGTTNRAFAINKTSDLHNFQIGFWDDLLDNHKRSLNSAIGEVMYFNRILSKNERYILEGKIAWKYGHADILPATHPYKTFSPV